MLSNYIILLLLLDNNIKELENYKNAIHLSCYSSTGHRENNKNSVYSKLLRKNDVTASIMEIVRAVKTHGRGKRDLITRSEEWQYASATVGEIFQVFFFFGFVLQFYFKCLQNRSLSEHRPPPPNSYQTNMFVPVRVFFWNRQALRPSSEIVVPQRSRKSPYYRWYFKFFFFCTRLFVPRYRLRPRKSEKKSKKPSKVFSTRPPTIHHCWRQVQRWKPGAKFLLCINIIYMYIHTYSIVVVRVSSLGCENRVKFPKTLSLYNCICISA